MDKSAKYLDRYKKIMKEFGWEVVHLKEQSLKRIKETIELLKKDFVFEDVILILRGKTTIRRISR